MRTKGARRSRPRSPPPVSGRCGSGPDAIHEDGDVLLHRGLGDPELARGLLVSQSARRADQHVALTFGQGAPASSRPTPERRHCMSSSPVSESTVAGRGTRASTPPVAGGRRRPEGEMDRPFRGSRIVALALAFTLAITGIVGRPASAAAPWPTPALTSTQRFDGETLFRALAFAQGPAAALFPEFSRFPALSPQQLAATDGQCLGDTQLKGRRLSSECWLPRSWSAHGPGASFYRSGSPFTLPSRR